MLHLYPCNGQLTFFPGIPALCCIVLQFDLDGTAIEIAELTVDQPVLTWRRQGLAPGKLAAPLLPCQRRAEGL